MNLSKNTRNFTQNTWKRVAARSIMRCIKGDSMQNLLMTALIIGALFNSLSNRALANEGGAHTGAMNTCDWSELEQFNDAAEAIGARMSAMLVNARTEAEFHEIAKLQNSMLDLLKRRNAYLSENCSDSK